jgi:Glycosyltransferase 61
MQLPSETDHSSYCRNRPIVWLGLGILIGCVLSLSIGAFDTTSNTAPPADGGVLTSIEIQPTHHGGDDVSREHTHPHAPHEATHPARPVTTPSNNGNTDPIPVHPPVPDPVPDPQPSSPTKAVPPQPNTSVNCPASFVVIELDTTARVHPNEPAHEALGRLLVTLSNAVVTASRHLQRSVLLYQDSNSLGDIVDIDKMRYTHGLCVFDWDGSPKMLLQQIVPELVAASDVQRQQMEAFHFVDMSLVADPREEAIGGLTPHVPNRHKCFQRLPQATVHDEFLQCLNLGLSEVAHAFVYINEQTLATVAPPADDVWLVVRNIEWSSTHTVHAQQRVSAFPSSFMGVYIDARTYGIDHEELDGAMSACRVRTELSANSRRISSTQSARSCNVNAARAKKLWLEFSALTSCAPINNVPSQDALSDVFIVEPANSHHSDWDGFRVLSNTDASEQHDSNCLHQAVDDLLTLARSSLLLGSSSSVFSQIAYATWIRFRTGSPAGACCGVDMRPTVPDFKSHILSFVSEEQQAKAWPDNARPDTTPAATPAPVTLQNAWHLSSSFTVPDSTSSCFLEKLLLPLADDHMNPLEQVLTMNLESGTMTDRGHYMMEATNVCYSTKSGLFQVYDANPPFPGNGITVYTEFPDRLSLPMSSVARSTLGTFVTSKFGANAVAHVKWFQSTTLQVIHLVYPSFWHGMHPLIGTIAARTKADAKYPVHSLMWYMKKGYAQFTNNGKWVSHPWDEMMSLFSLPTQPHPTFPAEYPDVHCYKKAIIGYPRVLTGTDADNFAGAAEADRYVEHVLDVWNISGTAACPPRITMIERTGSRKILNWDYIVKRTRNILHEFDVRVVRWETMSVSEQVRTAALSSAMIGMHGQGLAHIMYMPRESVVIKLMPYGSDMPGGTGVNKDRYSNFGAFARWRNHLMVHWQNNNPANSRHNELGWRKRDTDIPKGDYDDLITQARGQLDSILKKRCAK